MKCVRRGRARLLIKIVTIILMFIGRNVDIARLFCECVLNAVWTKSFQREES